MAIFDFFKKRKKEQEIKTKEQQKIAEKKEELKEKFKNKVGEQKSRTRVLTGEYPAWKVLKEPHITEKAANLVQDNEYVFKIYPAANKLQVKKAVQSLYKVKVEGVRIVRIPRKKKRLGRFEGWRKSYKKAIVKLAPGEKIEILPR